MVIATPAEVEGSNLIVLKTNEFNVLPEDCFVAEFILSAAEGAPRNDIKIPRITATKY